jgi:hypothetical protein
MHEKQLHGGKKSDLTKLLKKAVWLKVAVMLLVVKYGQLC